MSQADRRNPNRLRSTGQATAGALLLPLAAQLRLARRARPASERWQALPVHPRGHTQLGLSFRPRQAEAFGLPVDACLRELLGYPFQLIRLGAYWNRLEPAAGRFCPDELD